ncbi:MAG: 5'-nucleotidase, lipoprotein e(P4) family [Saprospiraceae bacterium]|nr:5'-nucleotidase, lipoprotein e(P4) family [Pyrinomonadaceae bacterium]
MAPKKYLLSLGLIASTVVSTYFVTVSTAQQPVLETADNDYQVAAVLYMQKAAEYRALAYQAFNLAKWQLDADLDKKNVKKLPKAERKMPRAIVVDIDETVLDNSPAQAYAIKNRRPFNLPDWYAWGEMRKAKAIPGSVEFLNYAVSKGVKIFYISNRDEVQKQATIDNLKSVGFPDISAENVLTRTKESGKDARRAIAAAKHRIVLLMGDNLDDFTSAFEKKSVSDRFAEVDKMKTLWGRNFIVLSNAMYGTWESAIYEYNRLTEAQKAAKRASSLELP